MAGKLKRFIAMLALLACVLIYAAKDEIPSPKPFIANGLGAVLDATAPILLIVCGILMAVKLTVAFSSLREGGLDGEEAAAAEEKTAAG